MFCPQCGSTQNEDLPFCKSCGTNLQSVRKAVTTRGGIDEKFDFSKTWVAEMLRSREENAKIRARSDGISPRDSKRRGEIKAGIITTSVGIGLMVVLFVLMQGIVASGQVDAGVAMILRSLWVAGVLPILIGLALIINGFFISKLWQKPEAAAEAGGTTKLEGAKAADFLPPKAITNPLERDVFSVTDETTRHLDEPVKVKATKI